MKRIKRNSSAVQRCESETSNSCVETSNIKFGKLDIVLQSYNTIPTIESFYDQIPDISSKKSKRINFEESTIIPQVPPPQCLNESILLAKKPDIFPCTMHPKLQISTFDFNSSSVYCWWCRITCVNTTEACFLPLHHDELRKTYVKHGFFCCWECTKAYNFDIRDIKTGMRSYMIQKVCRQLYGIKVTYSIKYSRHWSDLKRYGGIIEDEDFFKNKQQTTLSMIGAFRDTIK